MPVVFNVVYLYFLLLLSSVYGSLLGCVVPSFGKFNQCFVTSVVAYCCYCYCSHFPIIGKHFALAAFMLRSQ